MAKKYALLIDNENVAPEGGDYFPALNPYNGEIHAEVPQAGDAQVARAIHAARRAFEGGWAQTNGLTRARLLNRLADLVEQNAERIGRLETIDNGKVIRETQAQVMGTARSYRWYAGAADKMMGQSIPVDMPNVFDYTIKEPLGVCVLITAWNSPMAILCMKLAPAIAAGNCVVIKPSEHASCTTLELALLAREAGFPPGVINVVTGDHRVGQALTRNGRINKVSFTGSPGVGAEIAADAGRVLVPVTLELGGKSPNIIFDDADIDKAVVGALAGIFGASGQTCIAGSRLFVQRGVYDAVVARLAERARQIKLGDPLDPETEMGTAANEPQFRRILARIDGAVREGALLVTGGKPATGPGLDKGHFIEPTIFADVDNRMDLAQEEVFGPVLAIIPFETEEEVVRMANETRYGLTSGVWTSDISRAMRMIRAIEAGNVWINTYRAGQVMAPFGGFKDSGFGKERGTVALDDYTRIKNVMIDYSDEERDPFKLKS